MYYISYTGVITGSKELRAYNQTQTNGNMYDGNLTTFGIFCKEYDKYGGKAAEPFFDSIMAQIATSKSFDDNFRYVPVTPMTKRKGGVLNTNVNTLNRNNLKIYPGAGGVTFKLQLKNGGAVGRSGLSGYDTNGEHIFIMGPISNETFIHIKERSKTNKNIPLFIHLQGENGVTNSAANAENAETVKRDMELTKNTVGMTPHPGMFNNAFNLQSNLFNAIRFRKLMRDNATCYTVCMRDPKPGLPKIMEDFYKKIESEYIKSGGTKNNSSSLKLNINYITQDLYDKDNFVSLDQLVRASNRTPKIHLTGRAFFNNKEFKPLNKMTAPFKGGKLLPGFKSQQFASVNNNGKIAPGYNAAGAQNNNTFNKQNTFKYDERLSKNINKFIVQSWKKSSKILETAITSDSKVDFMNQKRNTNTNVPKPIGFHENMFVNVVGFWFKAFTKKIVTKSTIFNVFSNNLGNSNLINKLNSKANFQATLGLRSSMYTNRKPKPPPKNYNLG
jgi:hypothetical protein